MKKILFAILTLSILLIVLTTAALAADTATLPSNVVLSDVMYDSSTSLVSARMTFRTGLDGIVIMAVYNQTGSLKNITYTNAPSEYSDFNISLMGDKSYLGCPVKIFFWDSLSTLKPLNTVCTGVVELLPTSLAVIKEIGNATNDDGKNIWSVSYLKDGEDIPAFTTPEVATGTKPTIGDIVKIETDDNNVITKIVTVWDFTEDIRVTDVNSFDGTENDYALPVANADLINANSVLGEAYYGGYVTSYQKASKLMTIGGKEFKLSQAENVYVIDNTQKNILIGTGSAGNFECFNPLYETGNTVDIYDEMGYILFENLETSTAQKYADHVYVRLYQDRPVDVFIVKGAPYLTFE